MPTPFEHLASVNRLVHEPARLAILTALSACDKADFVFLGTHGADEREPLESSVEARAGRARQIEKRFEGKQPVTYAMLSGEGREALKEYRGRFEKIRKGARALKPLKVT